MRNTVSVDTCRSVAAWLTVTYGEGGGEIVVELGTAVNLYESGQLDDTRIQGQYVSEYEGSPDFWSQTSFTVTYLVFNYGEPPSRTRTSAGPFRWVSTGGP
jgi:hypothetical protein